MEPSIKRTPSPADYLANERTFLAWIRTGISIMAFGFVVVKFSLFVKQLRVMMNLPQGVSVEATAPGYSGPIGIALVVLGTLISVLAFWRYKQVENHLNAHKYHSTITLSLLLITSIVLAGILLALYLMAEI